VLRESGYSEQRTKALFKYIFRLAWGQRSLFWLLRDPSENVEFGGREDGKK
jgi:hypothetical protein